MDKKKVSVGIDDFKELIINNIYYVDKSNMICDLIDNFNKATLITRPRRFGKSLNMSMLKYFFEKTTEDNSYLFNGLKVSQNDKYMQQQGKYPVICINLSKLKAFTFEENIRIFAKMMAKVFEYHQNRIDFTLLTKRERNQWKDYTDNFQMLSISDLTDTILFLSECLEKSYNQKVIILIDEYDVPLDNAYFHNFYNQMTNFIRMLFESALKGNLSLHMAVLTGCLRISKESIFTGMNNLVVYSVTNKEYSQYYGFTEQEVKEILEYYNLQDKFETIKHWYDGYLYGGNEIYNPWSVLNYIKSLIYDNTVEPSPYWSNSSSNNIIQELIFESNREIKNDIETLVNGKTLNKPLYENMTYPDMNANKRTIWSFLLHTGYLKLLNSNRDAQTFDLTGKFVIPNIEILTIFKDEIYKWTNDILHKDDNIKIFNALVSADIQTFENELNIWLNDVISYMDKHSSEPEAFYHGLLLSLFNGFIGYKVYSNRESGKGRYDIVIKKLFSKNAIIMELKVTNEEKNVLKSCDEALQQIEDNQYDTDLLNEGYTNIIKYGITFYGKNCKIKCKI